MVEESRRISVVSKFKVGYRAQVQGRNLNLNVGYSHPVQISPPEGIQLAVEGNTNVIVSGFDKELVGNIAAQIRSPTRTLQRQRYSLW